MPICVLFAHAIIFSVNLPISWSSGIAFVFGVEGLRFKSRAGQIGHSVTFGSPPLRQFFERRCVAYRRNNPEMSPASLLHVSAQYAKYRMKDLILISYTSRDYFSFFFRKPLQPLGELSYDPRGNRKRSNDVTAQMRDFHSTAQVERDRAELLTRATVAEQQVREQQEYIDTHLTR